MTEQEQEQQHTFDCPACEREVEVLDSDSVPSMLGYGSDDSLQLACGHSITFDPFTGQSHASKSKWLPVPCPSCDTRIEYDPDLDPGACSACGWGPGMRIVAVTRSEHEACEAGTVGCSTDHTRDARSSCETW